VSYITTQTIKGSETTYSTASSPSLSLSPHEEWVGPFEKVVEFSQINYIVSATQVGSVAIEFSLDGVSVIRSLPSLITTLNFGNLFSIGPRAPWVRFRYTNGNAPANVNLYVSFAPTPMATTVTPVYAGVSKDSNSQVTKSVVFGRREDGSYAPVSLDSTGAVLVSTDSTAATSTPYTTSRQTPAVAAGSRVVMQSDAIAEGQVASLSGVIVTANAAFKAYCVRVVEDVESAPFAVWYTNQLNWHFTPPAADFVTVTGTLAGFTGFRVYVTNLDTSEAVDVFTVFYYRQA
jgi:hypothetical protein